MKTCYVCQKRPAKYGALEMCGACYERQRTISEKEKLCRLESSRRYKHSHREKIRQSTAQARWESVDSVEHRRKIERESYQRNRHKRLEKAHYKKALYHGVPVETVDCVAIYERDGGVCQLCMTPVEFGKMSLDHVIPIARGGGHVMQNVQTSHATCNRRKNVQVAAPFLPSHLHETLMQIV